MYQNILKIQIYTSFKMLFTSQLGGKEIGECNEGDLVMFINIS